MTIYYVEKNSEPTKKLFYKRILYRNATIDGQRALTDFIAEKYLYGRVNKSYIPIFANSDRSDIFKNINKKETNQANLKALNFVVDAFNALVQNFQKNLLAGAISADDPHLSNLIAYRAYDDPNIRYNNYMGKYVRTLRNFNTRAGVKIENFSDFSNNLLDYMQNKQVSSPLTFTSFCKNRRTPLTASGLVIEIAPKTRDKTNDAYKLALFYKSKNWEYYLKAAEVFGFMVDKNVPWRLVADINSEQMLEFASAYGYNSTDEILSAYFSDAHFEYSLNFEQRMLNMYNLVRPRAIQYTKETAGGKVRTYVKRTVSYKDVMDLSENFNEDYFIELYCKMRFIEEERKFTPAQQEMMIKDVINKSKTSGKLRSIRFFESIINKTFDYSGSIDYYIEKRKAIEEEQRQSQVDRAAITVGY